MTTFLHFLGSTWPWDPTSWCDYMCMMSLSVPPGSSCWTQSEGRVSIRGSLWVALPPRARHSIVGCLLTWDPLCSCWPSPSVVWLWQRAGKSLPTPPTRVEEFRNLNSFSHPGLWWWGWQYGMLALSSEVEIKEQSNLEKQIQHSSPCEKESHEQGRENRGVSPPHSGEEKLACPLSWKAKALICTLTNQENQV